MRDFRPDYIGSVAWMSQIPGTTKIPFTKVKKSFIFTFFFSFLF